MKKIKQMLPVAAALAFFLLPASFAPIFASEHPIKSTDGRQSRLWIVGDSSLHAYSSVANNMKVEFSFPSDGSNAMTDQLAAGQLKALDVSVPVKEMRSGKGGLDKNMQKALKADEHPNILFRMEKFSVIPSTIQPNGFVLKATGILEIAGTKKEVDLAGRLTTDGATARIEGTKDLLMTDYGIKPPKILLIKTANEVTVHYDLRIDSTGTLK